MAVLSFIAFIVFIPANQYSRQLVGPWLSNLSQAVSLVTNFCFLKRSNFENAFPINQVFALIMNGKIKRRLLLRLCYLCKQQRSCELFYQAFAANMSLLVFSQFDGYGSMPDLRQRGHPPCPVASRSSLFFYALQSA